MSEHALRSPSGAHTWMSCTASIDAIQDAIKVGELEIGDDSNIHSATGTVAHKLLETWLVRGSIHDPIGEIHEESGFKITIDEKMMDAVEIAFNYVMGVISLSDDNTVHIEGRVSFKNELLIEIGCTGGTADILVIDYEHKIIRMIDYKNGVGRVDAENNTQLMLYLLAAIDTFDFGEVIDDWCFELTIIQPNCIGKNPIDTWSGELIDILDWMCNELIPIAEKIRAGVLEYAPTESNCRYCPMAKNLLCDAYTKKVRLDAVVDFDEVELPMQSHVDELIKKIDVRDKIKIIKNKKYMLDFISNVELTVKKEIDAGSKDYVGALKNVLSNPNRVLDSLAHDDVMSPLLEWVDSPDNLYTKKKKGIGELEKELVKHGFTKKQAKLAVDAVCYKPDPYLVLVDDSDKRPAAIPTIQSEFKDI